MSVEDVVELLVSVIVSAVVSSVITEIRCRIHFACIDDMVKETLQHMKNACDEIISAIKSKTHC